MQITKHPSGKAVRSPRFGIISQPRLPYDYPSTPGLRKQQFSQAIGFTSDLNFDDGESPYLKDRK